MSEVCASSRDRIIPIRSPGFRRSLFVGVEESIKRRMNPTEPVVAARWLRHENCERGQGFFYMLHTGELGWPYLLH